MTWSRRVRVETQELSSYFESLVCKLESMSSQMTFQIFPVKFSCYEIALSHPTFYKMVCNKLEKGAHHAMKWHPIS